MTTTTTTTTTTAARVMTMALAFPFRFYYFSLNCYLSMPLHHEMRSDVFPDEKQERCFYSLILIFYTFLRVARRSLKQHRPINQRLSNECDKRQTISQSRSRRAFRPFVASHPPRCRIGGLDFSSFAPYSRSRSPHFISRACNSRSVKGAAQLLPARLSIRRAKIIAEVEQARARLRYVARVS